MQRLQLRVTSLFAAVIAVALTGNALAAPTQMHKAGRSSPTFAFLTGKKPTLAPFAHVRFCARNPGECTISTNVSVSGNRIGQSIASLSLVNVRVNSQITARSDDTKDGDIWEADVMFGDCEDYALTKRRALIRDGWPSSALRIAIGLTSSGEGHAVLVVTTRKGDFILDNRTNQIKPWNKSGLRFTKIQSSDNPKAWLSI